MSKKTNKFDFASDEERLVYLNKIVAFFHDERNEEVGLLAAEEISNFFLQTLGDEIYQKAIKDVKKIVATQNENLNFELDSLLPS